MPSYKAIPALNEQSQARFWARVHREGDGCWMWVGHLHENGYGTFGAFRAHRVAYTLVKGEIPEGLTLDHLCRNPQCVNPAHLEAVPLAVNTRRGDSPHAKHSRQTHCKFGHEFTVGNTVRSARGRECRQCKNRLLREWRQRQKMAPSRRAPSEAPK